MKWERGHKSEYVEDVRGQGGGRSTALKVGGGSAALLALVALVAQAFGVNLPLVGDSGGGGASTSQGGAPPALNADEQELYDFINYVVDDIQGTFAKVFAANGLKYQPAILSVFAGAVNTGCGQASADVGPFYCPADSHAYIDMSFYRDLRDRFGAPGDFAQAYVLAHEYGHHLQNLLGTDDKVRQAVSRDKSLENPMSVRQELQADCYAGIWAKGTAEKKIIEPGDIEESIKAAQAIGDDRLQKMAGQQVNPEKFTHGSSAQRARWFQRGFEAGTLQACDTFAAKEL